MRMNRNRIFAVIIILLLTANLIACKSYMAASSDQDLKVLHEKTFNIEPGKRLKLSGSSGDILLTSWDKPEVYVKILGNDQAREKVKFSFDAGKDMIEILARRDANIFGSSGIRLKYEVKVPAKFHTSLNTSGGNIRFAGVEGNNKLNTSGGDISIKETRGELTVSTSGGEITLGKSVGKLKLTTSGGSIRGHDFSGDLTASTSGGNIDLKAHDSKIFARTSGGDIILDYTGENRGIELSTSGGNIRIAVPEDFDASAYLNTSGGNVSFNVKTKNVKRLSSSRFEGDINNGGSKLVAKTSGGTIRVNSR
jgi:DUF4097 and DUF4098 domain-containing protein YvlB